MSSSEQSSRLRWWRNEDWLAVIIGGVVIAAVLAGWRPVIPPMKWQIPGDLATILTLENLGAALLLGIVLLVLSVIGIAMGGARAGRFIPGFVVVFGLAWLAQLLAGHSRARALGLEYVIFGLALGLIVNHAFQLPPWLREAVRTEFYIKTGLVILGSNILFAEVLQAGALGLVQALLVVTVVWRAGFWLARRMRVDDELAVMMSTAVAICGVSAAIAACGAIQGDRKKLSYVTSLVLILAVPMMILMPWIARTFGMPELVAGAWLGGTLDTSGSVVAAGQLISETAMKAGVIVKFSQNVLIGVAAFVLAIWWAVRSSEPGTERPTARVIWDRFPKFVLGFMAVSLLFSFGLKPDLISEVKPVLGGIRNYWFALAFVSIGLETHFGELVKMEEGRPAIAFVGAQGFNVIWTLLLAYLIFGGVLFGVPNLQ